jgi:hypothetical protein
LGQDNQRLGCTREGGLELDLEPSELMDESGGSRQPGLDGGAGGELAEQSGVPGRPTDEDYGRARLDAQLFDQRSRGITRQANPSL